MGAVVCPLFAFVAVFALFDIYIETIHMYILPYRSNKSNESNWSNLGKLFWGRPKNLRGCLFFEQVFQDLDCECDGLFVELLFCGYVGFV